MLSRLEKQSERLKKEIHYPSQMVNIQKSGNKVLYDITPTEKVEGARNRPHNPPAQIINQTASAVKAQTNSAFPMKMNLRQ